jgi:rhodanese-related sulfurtransferase
LSLIFWMCVIGAASTLPASKTGFQDPANLETLIRTGDPAYVLIDVRTRPRYEAGHIATAICIPVGALESRLAAGEKDSVTIVYGDSAGESARGQEILNKLGHQDAVCFNGLGLWLGGLVVGPEPGLPSAIPGYGPNDDELYTVACNAMRTDALSVAKEFIRMMKAKSWNFEDIYFSIHCDRSGPSGLMFHNSSSSIVSRALLSSLRAYEKSTGKTVVEPILNRLFHHPLFEGAPNQTLLDYLEWMKEGSSSAGLRKHYGDLIDLYRSYGAKSASELGSPRS